MRSTMRSQLPSLINTESMLLINDRQPKLFKRNLILNKRMRAYNQIYITNLYAVMNFRLAPYPADQNFTSNPKPVKQWLQLRVMLFSQNFSRYHKRNLRT